MKPFHRLQTALLAAILLLGVTGCRDALEVAGWPEDAPQVRQDIEQLSAWLDSPEYAREVTWEEHIVLAYKAAQGRTPTLLEYLLVQGLRTDSGIRRSDVLSFAMMGDDASPSWDKCRAFAGTKSVDAFRSSAETRAVAITLDTTSPEEVVPALEMTPGEMIASISDIRNKRIPDTTTAPNEMYETYFGFLHAHSHLSLDADPAGTPESAYAYARDEGQLDFFSLTDHAVFLIIWPWENKWKRLREVADAADDPGKFTALWGFEYSNPLLGHASVLNTDEFTHTLKTFTFPGLYKWLATRPEAIAQFNHPGDFDALAIEFLKFRPYSGAVPIMMGMETWNTNSGFDGYFYRGSSIDDPRSPLDDANSRGWFVGALGAQDNHQRDWGTLNDFRTGVLAKSLTREGIIEAHRERRFYATEDKDLLLDFRCSGYPMGSRLKGVERSFVVTLDDRSGDTFNEVRLYKNGKLIARQAVAGTQAEARFVDPISPFENFYYVMATQNDDNNGDGRNDEALSSPIWVRE